MPLERLERNEVAAVEFSAVGGVGIDLFCGVRQPDETIRTPPGASTRHYDRVTPPNSPLALVAHESTVQLEDQVVAQSLVKGYEDVDPQLDRRVDDCRFCDRSLLRRREHIAMIVAVSDN
jgi:hypothetical protein